MSDQKSEPRWNEDLIELIQKKLPEYKVFKGRVLKDIFLQRDKSNRFELQLGFFDQDLVIYRKDDVMDIGDLVQSRSIKIHNNNRYAKDKLIVPSVIVELKYDGVTTHQIITYSDIASDIKSIFPKCKYVLALRYTSSSSDNKLLRSGKNFDKIIYFEDGSNKGREYKKGQFSKELKKSSSLRKKLSSLINFIRLAMESDTKLFLK